MNAENVKLIAVAAVAIIDIYLAAPWQFSICARFWDALATICGRIANMLGWISMEARLNYFTVVRETQ